MVVSDSVKIASAPHSGLSVSRQRGCNPPPHSSVNRILVPSLLNVAECQNEKLAPAIGLDPSSDDGQRIGAQRGTIGPGGRAGAATRLDDAVERGCDELVAE